MEKLLKLTLNALWLVRKKQEIRFVTLILHTLCFAKYYLHHAIHCVSLEYKIQHFHSLNAMSDALTFLGLIFCSFLKILSMKRLIIIMVTVLCSRKRLCHLKLLVQKKYPQPKKPWRPEISTLEVNWWIIFLFWGTESLLQYTLEYCRVLLSHSLIWKAEPHLPPGDERAGALPDEASIGYEDTGH